ncbi:uncharacterized protein [Apostichopus japonicus]|uniref:uncharacterized protein n=1 Tax=Stichopus japonicus TaxID=307972 RepID=UPI003AB7BC55
MLIMALNLLSIFICIHFLIISQIHAYLRHEGLTSIDKRASACSRCNALTNGNQKFSCLLSNRCETFIGKRNTKRFLGIGDRRKSFLQFLQDEDETVDNESFWYF